MSCDFCEKLKKDVRILEIKIDTKDLLIERLRRALSFIMDIAREAS